MSKNLTLRVAGLSRKTTVRSVAVCLALAAIAIVCALLALTLGRHPLSLAEVVSAFLPGADARDRLVVVEWRAPRAAAALIFGACLGLSGAVFQVLLRNPLGSPDIIGLNSGAFTGVIGVIILGGSGYLAYAAGAVIGGLGAAALVYLLAYRRGIQGFRFIIVGIALGAMLNSVNTWFSVKADLDVSLHAAVWGAGTLNIVDWPPVIAAGIIAALLFCLMPYAARRLRQMELGDDQAAILGIAVERTKVVLVVIGVALTALVTAVAGPISFVALASPQIARRLTGTGGVDVVGSALVGAVLLTAADLLAQYAVPDAALPVGAVTVCLGGLYLVWLLFRESRKV